MLSPAKMEVIKVTTRSSLEHDMIRYLHDFTEIEFIDVEKKELAGLQTVESTIGKDVLSLLATVTSIIDNLDIPPTLKTTQTYSFEKKTLEDSVASIKKVLDVISPQVTEISQKISEFSKKIQGLHSLKETTELLVPLSLEFKDLGSGRYFSVLAGTMKTDQINRLKWNLDELTEKSFFFDSKVLPQDKKTSAVIIGMLNHHKDDVNRVLSSFGFLEVSTPKISGNAKEVLEDINKKISKHEKDKEIWDTKRLEMLHLHGEELLAIKEQLTIEKDRIEIKKMMRQTKYILQFWGFVSSSQKNSTEKIILSIDPEAIIEFNTPDFKPDDFPTKLENGKSTGRPYEALVTAYGPPSYKNDWDPSLLMAFTFPLLFGIMFADVFHGFLLLVIGILGIRMTPLGRAPITMGEEMKDYLQKGGVILTISAVFSITFGFMFNSFAGLHGEHAPSFMKHPIIRSVWLFSNDSHQYEAFGNAAGTFLMLQLSLVIGILHITLALFLLFVKKIQKRHYTQAILFPGLLILGYLSASVLIFAYGLNFLEWTSTESAAFDLAILPFLGYKENALIQIPAALPVTILMVIGFAGFFVYELTHGMDGFSEALDFIISLLGNSVSYARLFAINVVHSILALILYSALQLPERLPFFDYALSDGGHAAGSLNISTEILILIAFIVGTLITMTMELMITFLQALRLHLVEFFSKIHFAGSGRLFRPFHAQRVLTTPTQIQNIPNA